MVGSFFENADESTIKEGVQCPGTGFPDKRQQQQGRCNYVTYYVSRHRSPHSTMLHRQNKKSELIFDAHDRKVNCAAAG